MPLNADIDLDNSENTTTFFDKIKRFYSDDIEIENELIELIEKGININQQDQNGQTPLILAIGKSIKIVTALLAKKPNVNIQDQDGNAALHYATDADCTESVKMLIAANANVNIQNLDDKTTPLHWAVQLDRSEIIPLLLAADANPNLTDDDSCNQPLLHKAVLDENIQLIEMLLAALIHPLIWNS